MKFYKKILLILLPIIFTGCTVNYNIKFKSDNTLDENIKISETTSILQESGYSIDEIVESKLTSYSDEISNNFFSVKRENGKKTSVILSSKNKSLEKFVENEFFTRMFNGADIEESENKLLFKTNGDYNQSGLFYDLSGTVDEGFVDEININIKFEDKVLSSNADSYDESTNTYTWTINRSTEEKSIEFELLKDKNSKKQNNKFKIDKSIFVFIFVLIGIIFIIIIYVFSLNKKRNKL